MNLENDHFHADQGLTIQGEVKGEDHRRLNPKVRKFLILEKNMYYQQY
jgi:hypothetical protein